MWILISLLVIDLIWLYILTFARPLFMMFNEVVGYDESAEKLKTLNDCTVDERIEHIKNKCKKANKLVYVSATIAIILLLLLFIGVK